MSASFVIPYSPQRPQCRFLRFADAGDAHVLCRHRGPGHAIGGVVRGCSVARVAAHLLCQWSPPVCHRGERQHPVHIAHGSQGVGSALSHPRVVPVDQPNNSVCHRGKARQTPRCMVNQVARCFRLTSGHSAMPSWATGNNVPWALMARQVLLP